MNYQDFKMCINEQDVEVKLQENIKPCFNYFVCTCKEQDREFWKREMDVYSSDIHDSSLISSTLIMDLAHNYDMCVCDIGCDMWFGICISHKDHDFYIECDSVEYGLLCAIKIAEEIQSQNSI